RSLPRLRPSALLRRTRHGKLRSHRRARDRGLPVHQPTGGLVMNRLAHLLLLLAAPLLAQLSPEEAKQTFDEANTAYQAGESFKELDPATARQHYRRAALRYERLIGEGGL